MELWRWFLSLFKKDKQADLEEVQAEEPNVPEKEPSISDPISVDDVIEIEFVKFTTAEAHAVLALVNDSDYQFLDETVGLDKRAVNVIISSEHIESLQKLAEVPWMGSRAFTKLKAFVQ